MNKCVSIIVFLTFMPSILLADQVIQLGAKPPKDVVQKCIYASDWQDSETNSVICKTNSNLTCTNTNLYVELKYYNKFVASGGCEIVGNECNLKVTCAGMAEVYYDNLN